MFFILIYFDSFDYLQILTDNHDIIAKTADENKRGARGEFSFCSIFITINYLLLKLLTEIHDNESKPR